MPPGKIGSLSGVCRGNKWGVKQYVNHFLDVVNSLTNSGAEKYDHQGSGSPGQSEGRWQELETTAIWNLRVLWSLNNKLTGCCSEPALEPGAEPGPLENHVGVRSDLDGRRDKKVDLSSLTAAVVSRSDLHWWVLTYCNVDGRLELQGKCTEKKRSRHCLITFSLRLMYSKVIWLFRADKQVVE